MTVTLCQGPQHSGVVLSFSSVKLDQVRNRLPWLGSGGDCQAQEGHRCSPKIGGMMSFLHQLVQIGWYTVTYWGVFLYFWWWQQPITKLEIFGEQRLPLCHMYTLAKTLHLWHAPHYRATTFADDLRANLRNVAIPGTGIPLSVFCYSKATALLFILVINPAISLAAAVYCVCNQWLQPLHKTQRTQDDSNTSSQPCDVATMYRQLLLFPNHWFAIWRHSCMLVGYHALVSGSSSYRMEAKGTFLLEGQRLGLPVSPFYSDARVFVKHISIEGGMGIHVFRNFAFGGDWVIQRALSNSEQLSSMLPPGAPLSTLRVVTASTAWLAQQAAHGGSECTKLQQYPAVHGTHDRCSEPRTADDKSRPRSTTEQHGPAPFNSVQPASAAAGRFTPDLPVSAGILQQDEAGRHSSNRAQPWSSSNNGTASTGTAAGGKNSSMPGPASAACSNGNSAAGMYDGQVRVVTAVWRAGLAGKDTDHSSICFPMDPATGLLAAGVSANHWYRLGLKWAGRPDASTAGRTWLQHPDSSVTVAGATIPDTASIMQTVMHAHFVATPDVPLVGWDVALTPDGVFLLEMNLSCNLFNGSFDSQQFYNDMFLFLATLEKCGSKGPVGVCCSLRESKLN